MKNSKPPFLSEPSLILFLLVIGAAILTTLAQGVMPS